VSYSLSVFGKCEAGEHRFGESGEPKLTGFLDTGEEQLTGKMTNSCKSLSSYFEEMKEERANISDLLG
jgi:hypothetical protein